MKTTLNTNDIAEIKKIAKLMYRHIRKVRSLEDKVAVLNEEIESEQRINEALNASIYTQYGYDVFNIVAMESVDGTQLKEPELRYPETILPPKDAKLEQTTQEVNPEQFYTPEEMTDLSQE